MLARLPKPGDGLNGLDVIHDGLVKNPGGAHYVIGQVIAPDGMRSYGDGRDEPRMVFVHIEGVPAADVKEVQRWLNRLAQERRGVSRDQTEIPLDDVWPESGPEPQSVGPHGDHDDRY